MLVVEYEGTKYQGFQLQRDGSTIQGELETALEKVTGGKIRVSGASRTDSGVHAKAQVVSFVTSSVIPPENFQGALNFYLPKDIAIQCTREVPIWFNVRRDAVSRLYRYSILNSVTRSPIMRRFTHQVRKELDAQRMNEAAKTLIGTNDLASFCRAQDTYLQSTRRNVENAKVTRHDQLVVLDIQANSFLTQQIRRTMGELVKVGLGHKGISEFKRLIEYPRPGAASPTLSPAGLCLENIYYDNLNLGLWRASVKLSETKCTSLNFSG